MNPSTKLTLEEKLNILSDAAKYDVACTLEIPVPAESVIAFPQMDGVFLC